ncbi:MAG: NTP transferase domain-containing protein [Myxococcota bacterium]
MRQARLAVFVGGRSSRMGQPKGLLRVPGGGATIVEHVVECGRRAGLDPFLVGDAEPYADLETDVARIADDPKVAGPLGGLLAALRLADRTSVDFVVTAACDMPYIDVGVLETLRDHPSPATVLAARRTPEAPWEPMLTRYRTELALPALVAASGSTRSFQQFFASVEVEPLLLNEALVGALRDWDSPDDVVL